MTEQELRERLPDYKFYHTIPLTKDLATAGWPTAQATVELTLRNLRPLDLHGKRVLDIGCRDGVFSFQAEKMGAAEVVAIDNDRSPGAVELLIPFLRSRVQMHEMNLYDLRPETFGKFDLVVFPGVLYHLRYPMWGLKLIHDLLNDGGELLLETAVYVDDNRLALLFCPTGRQNPYYPDETSCTFFNVKGLTDTLTSLGLDVLRVDYKNGAPPRPAPGPGLRGRLRSVLFPGAAADRPVRVARALFHCRKTPALVNPYIAGYWDGTHAMHSGQVKSVPA
jgi:SAM-dependent methyltransferase